VAIFQNADEVCTYVGRMFELFVQKPEYEDKIKESGLVVRLNYADPDCIILIDFPNQKVFYNEAADAATAPNVDMYMTCDDAHRFWIGKLNFPIAMARRKVRMEGSTAKAMKLLPLTNPLFATYKQLLEDAGRADLLTAA
jgi:putative sterol carrier protein